MANETTRPLKVFLCHASGDKPAVRDLYKRLLAEGVDAWLDEEKLLPGQDWNDEILRALQESDAIIICLSKTSVSKEGYVQREIKEALEKAKEKPSGAIFVIPSKLDDCEIPNYLRQWQWVDLFAENGFVKLLRSLKLRADRVGATIEPLGYESEDKEIERRLNQLYTDGLAAFYTEDWDRAYQRFQSILSQRPNHKPAAEKLAEADRQRNLAKLYAQAEDAYKTENWPAAIRWFDELVQKSADYKDAAQLLRDARKQNRLKDLYIEAETLHSAQKWHAVLKVFEQITAIEPAYPDPQGLLPSAQKEAAELKRLADLNELYSQGIHKMDAGNWYEARDLLEQVHKAQTGFLDTERLLRKIENEILRLEERRKRDAQVQMLYEQARKMTRTGQWGKALAQMEELQKLDSQFVDSDGILQKAKAELEREEQDAQRRRELAALYAEAVSLLEAKKYQEALEKWNAVQAIDPKYKDTARVKTIARRKLEELSRPETVGGLRPKIITDWFRLEANIPVDREICTEKLLLLSFVFAMIIRAFLGATLVSSPIWESSIVARSLSSLFLGGMYGAIVAFALNKSIYNWRLKHSLIMIVGWALSLGVPEVVAFYFARYYLAFVLVFTGLSIVAAIKWARPSTRINSLIIIFVIWALTWKAGNILGLHLSSFDSDYTWAMADALLILLGLLFTFGVQVERSWEILKTALFGTLGFAVGNFIADPAIISTVLPTEIFPPVSYALWGLIGGAILAAPSRNARQILITAGICGIGLLVGYYIFLIVSSTFGGQSYLEAFPDRYHILRNIILGIGLGLTLGLLIRRASAIGILVILGVGIFIITRALNADIFTFPDIWKATVRGALIGLVLGYAYGYLRKTTPLQSNPILVITKQSWIGIVGSLAIILTIIVFRDPTMYDDFNNPLYNGKFNTTLWNADITAGKVVQENGFLTLELNDHPGQFGIYTSKSYKPTSPFFFESKIKLDPTSRDGSIYASFGSSSGDTACTIFAPPIEQASGCSSELELPEIPQEGYVANMRPGTWHIVRIELYPDTMTFVFFVDGNKIGSYVPQDPDNFRDLSYTPFVFVQSGTDSAPSIIGYVESVRIGKIEE